MTGRALQRWLPDSWEWILQSPCPSSRCLWLQCCSPSKIWWCGKELSTGPSEVDLLSQRGLKCNCCSTDKMSAIVAIYTFISGYLTHRYLCLSLRKIKMSLPDVHLQVVYTWYQSCYLFCLINILIDAFFKVQSDFYKTFVYDLITDSIYR